VNELVAEISSLFILLAITLSISIIDWRTMRIPNWINALLGVSGLLFSNFLPLPGAMDAIAGGVIGGALALILRSLYFKVKAIHGLGLGDVKLIAASGCWTGTAGLMPMLFVASIVALSYCGVQALAGRRVTSTTRLPFGPFLCSGLLLIAAVHIIYRHPIIDFVTGR